MSRGFEFFGRIFLLLNEPFHCFAGGIAFCLLPLLTSSRLITKSAILQRARVPSQRRFSCTICFVWEVYMLPRLHGALLVPVCCLPCLRFCGIIEAVRWQALTAVCRFRLPLGLLGRGAYLFT